MFLYKIKRKGKKSQSSLLILNGFIDGQSSWAAETLTMVLGIIFLARIAVIFLKCGIYICACCTLSQSERGHSRKVRKGGGSIGCLRPWQNPIRVILSPNKKHHIILLFKKDWWHTGRTSPPSHNKSAGG